MLGAGQRQASLIDYAGWKVLGVYPEVKGGEIYILSVQSVAVLNTEGFNRWAQPGRIISEGISITGRLFLTCISLLYHI